MNINHHFRNYKLRTGSFQNFLIFEIKSEQTTWRSIIKPADYFPERGTKTRSSDDKYEVAALSRGLKLLEAFDAIHLCLGNAEIAERTGLAKSTVSRLTYTFTQSGFLQFDAEAQKYRLGAGVGRLAALYCNGRAVVEAAKPCMEMLGETYGASVMLLERAGLEMVSMHFYKTKNAAVVVNREPDSRLPLAQTSAGRAYLAHCALNERDWLLGRLAKAAEALGHAGFLKDLEPILATTRAQGFASSYGELNVGVNAVGVALRSPVDGTLLSMNISAPQVVLPVDRCQQEVGPALIRAAREIEERTRQMAAS